MKDLQAKMIADATTFGWDKSGLKIINGVVQSVPSSKIDYSVVHSVPYIEITGVKEKITGPVETDPTGKFQHQPGAKVDAGKNRGWLFFKGYARALKAVSEVTTEGAKKYTPDGWKTVENGEERYMDAAIRHLFDVGMGKKYDNGIGGIGTLHMAQVIWNLLSVLELQLQKEEQTNAE